MGDETNQPGSELAQDATRTASCPRCGYDLEGARAAWKDSCPLTGVCSECGYGFEWADVLIARRRRIMRHYEHAHRWWRIDAASRTLTLALIPHLYWRVHRLHTDVVPRRLLIWPVLIWFVTLVGCAIFTVTVFGTLDLAFGTWPTRWVRGVPVAPELSLQEAWSAIQGMLPLRVFQNPFGSVLGVGVTPTTQAFIACVIFNASASLICWIGRSHRLGTMTHPVHLLRVSMIGLAPGVAHLLLCAAVWLWLHVTPVISIATRGSSRGLDFPAHPPRWLHDIYYDRAFFWDDAAMFGWLLLWWWSALHLGLRFQRPFAIWAAASTTGALTCILLGLRSSIAVSILG